MKLKQLAIALSAVTLSNVGIAANDDGWTRHYEEARKQALSRHQQGERVHVEWRKAEVKFYRVQITDIASRVAANIIVDELKQRGIDSYSQRYGTGKYRINIGSFVQNDRAENRARQLRQWGFDPRVQEIAKEHTVYRVVKSPEHIPPPPVEQSDPIQQIAAEDEDTLIFEDDEAEDLFVFSDDGDSDTDYSNIQTNTKNWFVDPLRVEAGFLEEQETNAVETSHYFHTVLAYQNRLNKNFSLRLGARVDGYYQTGNPEFDHVEVDYEEIYLRFATAQHKLTLGSQKILWTRMEEFSPSALLAPLDLTRYVIDDWSNRYRTNWAARYEFFSGAWRFELAGIPEFREAELPEKESIWFPLDFNNGRILGVPEDPQFGPVYSQLTIDTDPIEKDPMYGMRVTYSGNQFDLGISFQQGQQSTPFVFVNPELVALLGSQPINEAVINHTNPDLIAIYPETDLVSLDGVFNWGDSIWRFEVAHYSDVPVYGNNFQPVIDSAMEAAISTEFYPGDGNTRFYLQYNYWQTDADLIAQTDHLSRLSFEFEQPFAHEMWRFTLRGIYSFYDDLSDYYVNPELTYLGIESSEWYISFHYFDGDPATAGEFHQYHDLLAFGFRREF